MIMESLIFSMFVLVINLVLWLVFFYKFKTTYSPERVLKSIRVEVDKLFTEIMRTTEEDVTLIEARIAGLKDLIAQADERILLADSQIFEASCCLFIILYPSFGLQTNGVLHQRVILLLASANGFY